MKIFQSSFFRAICAIIIGILLIQYREQTLTWITIAIGILFFISGILSIAEYVSTKKLSDKPEVYDSEGKLVSGGPKPHFPILGVASLLLGVILALMTNMFITSLTYIISGVLIIGAIGQFIFLANTSKYASVGFYYWIMPSVILIVGIIAIVYPTAIATAPLFVIGWCMLLYGVVECINALKAINCRKQFYRKENTELKNNEAEE
ncbi:HdeD family acid-resistance protein [Prevotella sp.]|uniref:HdeD family acid-resistance protein n=1 Tax=Prevotella sp. TaxID=59823 RepID=UPI003DA60958